MIKPILKTKTTSVICPANKKRECDVYRVVRTFDKKNTYYGAATMGILIQPVDFSQEPVWDNVCLGLEVDTNSLLKYDETNRCWIKSTMTYNQYMDRKVAK